jgi:transcription antitermination factor NusG
LVLRIIPLEEKRLSENRMDFEKSRKNIEKNWFALYTKPRSEFRAAEQLESNAIHYYLPTVTTLKQWSDRKKKITEPIIRGYIFIKADERERLVALEQYSIVRCVTERGKPAVIPEWQIDNLKKMLEYEGDFFVLNGLAPGKRVKIKDGPFAGVEGIYCESENEKTISVSIDLLNRSVIAHLPKESVIEIIS